jgi:hypothetical protein
VSPLTIRRWHSYISLLGAPSIIFFTFSGVLQLFHWHEAEGAYHPPAWIETLSAVHMDQTLQRHKGEKPPAEAEKLPEPDVPPMAEPPPPGRTIALKAYFFWVGASLVVSSLFGVWMGIAQTPRKRLAWSLLVIGTLLPVGILLS